jgi:hypothetical protein
MAWDSFRVKFQQPADLAIRPRRAAGGWQNQAVRHQKEMSTFPKNQGPPHAVR